MDFLNLCTAHEYFSSAYSLLFIVYSISSHHLRQYHIDLAFAALEYVLKHSKDLLLPLFILKILSAI